MTETEAVGILNSQFSRKALENTLSILKEGAIGGNAISYDVDAKTLSPFPETPMAGVFKCVISIEKPTFSSYGCVFSKPDKGANVESTDVTWVSFDFKPNGTIGFENLCYVSGETVEKSAKVYFAKDRLLAIFALALLMQTDNGIDDSVIPQSENTVKGKAVSEAIDDIEAVISNQVTKVAFDNSKASLDGIKIGTTAYKVVPCGNASGANSTADGAYSTASGGYSIAIGAYSIASGDYSTASGYGSTASGGASTAIGQGSVASGNGSVAIGVNSSSKIDNMLSISSASRRVTYSAYSPDYVFFLNQDVSSTYTNKSQYANGHNLTDYLGSGSPTIVTETIANIVANASAYFAVTGAGTSGDPYIVKPKADLAIPHAHRLYKLALSTAPASDTYVIFQGATTERCELELTSTLNAAATKYFLNFRNISGYVRARNVLNNGTFSTANIDVSSANFIITLDLNGPEMYATIAL